MKKESFFKNILFLNKMYMPKIINILYILSVIASIIFGLFHCSFGILYLTDYEMKVFVVQGIALIILCPVVSRICAEQLVILFKINERLEKLADMNISENKQNNING